MELIQDLAARTPLPREGAREPAGAEPPNAWMLQAFWRTFSKRLSSKEPG